MTESLRRKLGLLGLTASGVGMILGAGIYALIGASAGLAGNMIWVSFLIGAFISSFTGLSYAELSSMIPKAAAEVSYLKESFEGDLAPISNRLDHNFYGNGLSVYSGFRFQRLF